MSRLLTWVLLWNGLLQASTALASSPLEKANAAYEAMKLDAAERFYKEALKAPGSRQERLSAWKGLGITRASMGNERGAKESFVKLLLLDASATVDELMGPKITRPFEMARKGVGLQKNRISLQRGLDGEVEAELKEDVPMAKSLLLHVREESGGWKTVEVAPGEVARVATRPTADVEAWAQGFDEYGGELYLEGSEASPVSFSQPKPHPAVASAEEKAKTNQEEWKPSKGLGTWPYWVGAAVVVVAATTVGVVMSQPTPLDLPEAQRVTQLP